MDTTESLGDRLRRLRTAQGLSQQDLATSGVHASYVSLIEAGRRHPSPRILAVIAEQLGTTADYLVTGIDEVDRHELELQLGTGKLLLDDGDAAGAVAVFRRLLHGPDARIALEARWGLAAALEAVGDLDAAITEYTGLRDCDGGDPTTGSQLSATTALCRCYREVGDLGMAIEVGERALGRYRQLDLAESDAYVDVLLTVAMAYLERGDLTRTRQLLDQAEHKVDSLGTPRARGAAYWNAAVLAGEMGDKAEAVRLIERAVGLFGEGNDERHLARLRNAYATLVMRLDPSRAGEAAAMLRTAREQLSRLGSDVDVAYCDTELARALTLTGHADEAVQTARSVLSRLEQGQRLEAARARCALAYALVAVGEVAVARIEYMTAATALESMGARRQAALVWLELADMERSNGDVQQALTALERSLTASGLTTPFPPAHTHARPL